MWSELPLMLLVVGCTAGADFRLSGDVVPRHYQLMYTFDIDPDTNFSFYGVSKILINVKKNTHKITLHIKKLSINKDNLELEGDGKPMEIKSTSTDDELDSLTIKSRSLLHEGHDYTIAIPFYGNVDEFGGAYISSYTAAATQTKEHLIVTHFEPISARQAFPCFDEPMMKATFTITIGHHTDYSAISNMPLETTVKENMLEPYWSWVEMNASIKKPQSDFQWDVFTTTVPMSTYLVAFIVSKFEHIVSPAGLSRTQFKIWARKEWIHQTKYASVTGPKVLSFFESWFGVKYPLPKLDMATVPDFYAGATENWGLVTYREDALLYNKKQSSLDKETIVEVIGHELSHQWFGNLVTMKWWSDKWLNEGFATYMGIVATAAVQPAWDAEKIHSMEKMLHFMALDSLESSHPVSTPLEDMKSISEIFDEITYHKGSILVRMMVHFLGVDVFKKALHEYLVKYSYSNAEQDDLWRELTEMSIKYSSLTRNVTVKQIMDTWTKQPGYPILTATRDYAQGTATVAQKRYLSMANETGPARTSSSWWVPLNVLCEKEVTNNTPSTPSIDWLANNEGTTSQHQFTHESNENEWLLLNKDMIAPYRVNYDRRNWQLLVSALNSEHYARVPQLSRVQLLSDAFDLAWINLIPYSTALELTNYLHRETEYLPLNTGLGSLFTINAVLKHTSDYGVFQKYVRKLISKAYKNSGRFCTKKNKNNNKNLKKQVLLTEWACSMQVPECKEGALKLFNDWSTTSSDNDNPIPVELRGTVYCTGVAAGGAAAWRRVLAARQRTTHAAASQTMLLALACSREPWILVQCLEWALYNATIIRRQDSVAMIDSITRSPVGFYVARGFLYDNIQDIYDSVGDRKTSLGNIVKALVSQFTKQAELDEFLSWRDKNKKYLEGNEQFVGQAIEQARVNINWINKNRQEVVNKLREFSDYTGSFDDLSTDKFTEYITNSATKCYVHFIIYVIVCL